MLDFPVQGRRDANAAKWFFKRLLRGLQFVPRVIVTDKLGAIVSLTFNLPSAEDHQSRCLDNRARTHIGQRDDESVRSIDSNRPIRPRIFSPPIRSSMAISVHGDT